MLWAALSLHLFSVVIWLGSLCYMSAILIPVLEAEGKADSDLTDHFYRRGLPFLWLSMWSLGITGVALYVFTPEFFYGRNSEEWFTPVHAKIFLFGITIGLSLRLRSIYRRSRIDGVIRKTVYHRMARTIRIMIFFGISALLLAAWDAIL